MTLISDALVKLHYGVFIIMCVNEYFFYYVNFSGRSSVDTLILW